MPPSRREDRPEFEWVAYEMIRGPDPGQREWHLSWAGGEITGDPRIRVLRPGEPPFVASLSELRDQGHPIGRAKLDDFERDRPFAITPDGFRRGARFWRID
jgi:hypothetical protein